MVNDENNSIIGEARKFLEILRDSSEYESLKHADEILLYLYSLQDNYTILKSRSPRFSEGPVISLRHLIYQLESDPEETFRNYNMKNFMTLILEDIAFGRVDTALKH